MPALPDRDAVLSALRAVIEPDIQKDIVTLGLVKDIAVENGRVAFTIELMAHA